MPHDVTPRQLLDSALRGGRPVRPLLLPIVFSLGAKIQGLPLPAFLRNPQKICNSLRDIRGFLRVDGVAGYFDPALQPEAIPVAAEVIRRLRPMLGQDALLFAGTAGPFTMAHRSKPSGKPDPAAAAFLHRAASQLVEAGADLIFIIEEALPKLSREQCQDWMESLGPTFNVIRFFGALPVLLLPDPGSVAANFEVLRRERWNCVLCPAFDGLPLPAADVDAPGFGMALPVGLLQPAGSAEFALPASIRERISEYRPVLVTTAGDVPGATDMKCLAKAMRSISALAY